MASNRAQTTLHQDKFASSSLVTSSGIFLAASAVSTSSSPVFRGRLKFPRRTADLALALAHVVESRFYTPPGMLQRLIASRDPVITCDGEMLRLEGFSACCGVYARLDLLKSAFDAESMSPGTSNVDFNPAMRAALTQVSANELTWFELTAGGFTLESSSVGKAFEKKVDLPTRWVKGFQEVQCSQSRMKSFFKLAGPIARRFINGIPRQASRGPMWLVPSSNSIRLSQTPSPGALQVGGLDRLRILSQISQHANLLEAYGSDDGSTAWRLETPDSHFFIVLSPGPSRGFSGEGQLLSALTMPAKRISKLRALLRWKRAIHPDQLSSDLDCSIEEAVSALAMAASSGIVGYDLVSSTYFHRELPFAVSDQEKQNPRFAEARKLAETGKFEFDANGIWLRGKGIEYRLVKTLEGDWSCPCPWSSRYGDSRGPCKHILAVELITKSKNESDAR